MCGIIGYTGSRTAAPILLEGLKRLEYRGYDSAGIAVAGEDKIRIEKTSGKVDRLIEKVHSLSDFGGCCGIGHTRWATHGVPSDVNAHPHMSADGKFAVVHNGIIENYASLRQELEEKGIRFLSETDTEVVVQLLSYYYSGDLCLALKRTLSRIDGSYALGVLSTEEPDTIYVAKSANPLLIGLGSGENFFASDITALVSHTRDILDLEDGELARIQADRVCVMDMHGNCVEKHPRHITWDVAAAEKSGYDHFMLKEIMEQPAAIKATLEPRIRNGMVCLDELTLNMQSFRRIVITACGSAYYAGCVGKMVLEKLCRLPVETVLASELRYSDPVIDEHTLTVVISQSGETADSIAALRECQSRGSKVLAIVNVVGSTIARLADAVLYTRAGPEIAVATTKGYTTQVAVLDLFAIWAAHRLGTVDEREAARLTCRLSRLPERAQRALDLNAGIRRLAEKNHDMRSLFFIGRNLDYAVCLEGSLKLKEISYIHSEAYAAGELKHGTIALIEPGRLVIALCCQDALLDKTVSNMQQVKARGARLIAIANEGNRRVYSEADDVIAVPGTEPLFTPAVEIIPLQLFAYYVAKANGCDIDKPKNLAKSVTVE